MVGREALLPLVLALLACGRREPLPYSGFVDAPISAVASQIAGQVQSILVKEGDRVRKGQVLAKLDSREREAMVAQAEAALAREQQALSEAEANVRATTPTVTGAGADIARAQATADEARRNYERVRRLEEARSATPADLDTARARLREAEAALRSVRAGKEVARGKVTATEAALASAQAAVRVGEAALEVAKVQLAQAELLSPFDGLVVDRNLEEGEWAAPGTPVVTVEDLGGLWVRLDIEESHFSGLKLGQPATIRVIALPGHTFRGHLMEVGPLGGFAVNRDVRRGRPDIRTFRVRVAFDERSEALRPGMTAEVQLSGDSGASEADGGAR